MKTTAAIITLLAWLAGIAVARAETVDLLLVLAADVSRSIDDSEFNLQRRGYAAAITDPRVLRAIAGGVLRRAGHTEAAIDLVTLAGLSPAGVLCEIMSDDGTMARLPELRAFAARHRYTPGTNGRAAKGQQQTDREKGRGRQSSSHTPCAVPWANRRRQAKSDGTPTRRPTTSPTGCRCRLIP